MLNAGERTKLVKKAMHHYNVEDCNCAETVCITMFGDYYKKPVNTQDITALAGGKIGICAAVAVAYMAISRKYGRTTPKQNNHPATVALQKFNDILLQKYGSLACIKIKSYLESEQQESKSGSDTDEKLCTPLVEDVVKAALYTVESFTPADFKI